MCGIAGLVGAPGSFSDLAAVVTRMTDTLTHRGPDGAGVWLGDRAEVALGHRRLSVIDVTEGGSQPMTSASGRYAITFNGEI